MKFIVIYLISALAYTSTCPTKDLSDRQMNVYMITLFTPVINTVFATISIGSFLNRKLE